MKCRTTITTIRGNEIIGDAIEGVEGDKTVLEDFIRNTGFSKLTYLSLTVRGEQVFVNPAHVISVSIVEVS